jgi:hypothetical protein
LPPEKPEEKTKVAFIAKYSKLQSQKLERRESKKKITMNYRPN